MNLQHRWSQDGQLQSGALFMEAMGCALEIASDGRGLASNSGIKSVKKKRSKTLGQH